MTSRCSTTSPRASARICRTWPDPLRSSKGTSSTPACSTGSSPARTSCFTRPRSPRCRAPWPRRCPTTTPTPQARSTCSRPRVAAGRRVVYAGSSSAYGEPPSLPVVGPWPPRRCRPTPCPNWRASTTSGVRACVWRGDGHIALLQRVGPRQDPKSQYAAVIPRFITAALDGSPPTVYGDGEQSPDFCFIDNVVEANLRAADADGVSGRSSTSRAEPAPA